MTLDDKRFLEIVDVMPLVAVDLIIRNSQGQVLLGKRRNRPAQGLWFVPGGRIRKSELISDAVVRISQSELGIRIRGDETGFFGVFEHIYDDNFLGAADISIHYISLAYECELKDDSQVKLDGQHSDVRWWGTDEIQKSEEVHKYTRGYFAGGQS